MKTLDKILVGVSLVGSLTGFAGCEEKKNEGKVSSVQTVILPEICKDSLWLEVDHWGKNVYCKDNGNKDLVCRTELFSSSKEWACYTLDREAK